ncbi:MAG: hypothetical protein IJO08_04190 [Clostridia bacterium]|nr:hypothetical protein [Clostridia bacterium]
MKKKIWIAVIVLLILVGIIAGIFILKGSNTGNEQKPINSGDISGEISGEIIEVVSGEKEPLFESGEIIISEYPALFPVEDRGVYLDEQVVKLEEIEEKNFYWTYTISDPSVVEINSDEKEFKYSEYMVGTVYDRLYKMKGLKKGEALVKFEATLNVNGTEEDFQSVEYWVNVNSDNKIAIYTEKREIYR